MDFKNDYRFPGYTIDDLADDIGDTVHYALAPIIRRLADDKTQRSVERMSEPYRAEILALRKAIDERDANFAARTREHQQEIEAVRAECEQRLRDQEARHRENIAAWERAQVARMAAFAHGYVPAVDLGAQPVSIPHTGQVPAVLHDVPGPLFRIRWQQGQPAGEGEPWAVPEGWVLDDDQAGTWLDRINTRHCTGL